MMAERLQKFDADSNLSHLGGGEGPVVLSVIKRDLEGWREVLLPLSDVLCWTKPYYPAVIVGATTLMFGLIWLSDISTLTAISLVCLLVGLLDMGVPYFGATLTGYQSWTAEEEYRFTGVCEHLANLKSDTIDMWQGLISLRQNNSKMFFLIVMGFLSFTAWIGNLVNNLFLAYVIVTFLLCLPGMQRNEATQVYLKRATAVLAKLRGIIVKPKEQ